MFGKPRGIEPGLPGEYLLDALFEVGPSEWQAGNEGPVSWQALAAYADGTRAISDPWEYRAVMAMSKAYFAHKTQGKNPHAIEPVDALDDGRIDD